MRAAIRTFTAIAFAILALAAGEARAAPLFGFNDDAEAFVQEATDAERAGARIARIGVSWELAEPRPNAYDWSKADAAVAALRGHGVRQLFVVHAAPRWASPGCAAGPGETCGVGDQRAYVDFVLQLLHRYPGSKMQVWNEPNVFGAMPADQVAQLTRAVHRALPGRVVSAAPAPSEPDQWRYQQRLLAGIPKAVPMAVHLYPRTPFAQRGLDEYWRRAKRIAAGRPIWVTEIGFAESLHGPDGQARLSVDALRFLADHGARAVIFHRLRDEYYDWSPWLSSLGVIRADGSPKPAFNALRRAVARLG